MICAYISVVSPSVCVCALIAENAATYLPIFTLGVRSLLQTSVHLGRSESFVEADAVDVTGAAGKIDFSGRPG